MGADYVKPWIVVLLCCIKLCCSVTDPDDLKILIDFKKGLQNPELLNWPGNGDDPCGPPKWDHVFCSNGRVTQIQVQNLGLTGPLPQNFNQLVKLQNLGLQRNNFTGKLPTFKGLSDLMYAYLDFNNFDTIPSDFFDGLSSIQVLALNNNPFNKSTGWSLPLELGNSLQLRELSLSQCNLVGPLPDFLGNLPSLDSLRLSYNRLSGEIPVSFGQSSLSVLLLNNQDGAGMTGPIDVVANMTLLRQLWLHGNSFSGTIPNNIGALSLLKDLNLNGNQLVGPVPQSLADLELDNLDLNNNHLMGPIPRFKAGNVSYVSNSFCQSTPGIECAPQVNALLDFLASVNYPLNLVSAWVGNDPCQGLWVGLSCDVNSKVSGINLPRRNLTGILSPSIAKLDSLLQINLGGNNISGTIPSNFSNLNSLRLLDVSRNNLSPPLPNFRKEVKLVVDGNPRLEGGTSPPPQPSEPPLQSPPVYSPPGIALPPPSSNTSMSPSNEVPPPSNEVPPLPGNSKSAKLAIIVGGTVGGSLLVLGSIGVVICCKKKKKKKKKEARQHPTSVIVHPRDPYDPERVIKFSVSNNTTGSLSAQTETSYTSNSSSLIGNSHIFEAGKFIISVQVLRRVTGNFAAENQLGRGGFGTVYKGELEDGTRIAVKRMEAGAIGNKAFDEFQAEIAVLSKVRHRHLVSLLGYSIEDNEKLLVYEYMPQGALSKHLFHWKNLNLEPLSWKKRLSIALDVARGMEYLHSLTQHTFIHRDLKSSNILLDNEFHAKVSDFGLVKLAPDKERSVATRLAGTFGYLAPEYAVMGKVTTKVDVFSYGVVLMELLTGLIALDEERPEENRYLAEWFRRIKSSEEKLKEAIDPGIVANEEAYSSISIVAELAGHCTARDPNHRPDMAHVVNVLSPLIGTWKPICEESEDFFGINYEMPLSEMLKVWRNADGSEVSYNSTGHSNGLAIPSGFADSFTSADAR